MTMMESLNDQSSVLRAYKFISGGDPLLYWEAVLFSLCEHSFALWYCQYLGDYDHTIANVLIED